RAARASLHSERSGFAHPLTLFAFHYCPLTTLHLRRLCVSEPITFSVRTSRRSNLPAALCLALPSQDSSCSCIRPGRSLWRIWSYWFSLHSFAGTGCTETCGQSVLRAS